MNIEAVVFDCGRTLYQPETISLFPGTRQTLEALESMGIKMGLLSVAVTEDLQPRWKEIEDSGLKDFFGVIDIVPRSTIGKDFTKILKDFAMEEKTDKCLIVGDNLKREIECGNKIGAFTVWTKQNLSADWKPQNEMQIPRAIIYKIEELVPLVEELNR